MEKKSLKQAFFLIVLMIGLFCFGQVKSAGFFYDNLESYNVGVLAGQDNWSGSSAFAVQTSTVSEGIKAVEVVSENGQTYDILKSGTQLYEGEFSIKLRKTAIGNSALAIFFQHDTTENFGINLSQVNDKIYILKDGGWFESGDYIADHWYLLRVKWKIGTSFPEFQFKLDEGDWSQWYETNVFWSYEAGLNTIKIRSGENSGTNTSYFDCIGVDGECEEAPPEYDVFNDNFNSWIQDTDIAGQGFYLGQDASTTRWYAEDFGLSYTNQRSGGSTIKRNFNPSFTDNIVSFDFKFSSSSFCGLNFSLLNEDSDEGLNAPSDYLSSLNYIANRWHRFFCDFYIDGEGDTWARWKTEDLTDPRNNLSWSSWVESNTNIEELNQLRLLAYDCPDKVFIDNLKTEYGAVNITAPDSGSTQGQAFNLIGTYENPATSTWTYLGFIFENWTSTTNPDVDAKIYQSGVFFAPKLETATGSFNVLISGLPKYYFNVIKCLFFNDVSQSAIDYCPGYTLYISGWIPATGTIGVGKLPIETGISFYGLHTDPHFSTATQWYLNATAYIDQAVEVINNYWVSFADLMNASDSAQYGEQLGMSYPKARGYLEIINSFFGGIPFIQFFLLDITLMIIIIINNQARESRKTIKGS